jgi:hypothetical protein
MESNIKYMLPPCPLCYAFRGVPCDLTCVNKSHREMEMLMLVSQWVSCPFWERFPDEWEGDGGPQSRLVSGGAICHMAFQERLVCDGNALVCPLIGNVQLRSIMGEREEGRII